VIIVSDTSSLCYLALIGRESLLAELYGEVVIPPAVAGELAHGAVSLPVLRHVLDAPWLVVCSLNHQERADMLAAEVDRGEAEAIALFEELKADLLLLDDKEGRQLAERLGVKLVGLLGVLVEAHHAGLLPDTMKSVLDELAQHGFRASRALIEHILKKVGEEP